ncbi:unnamed protein product, partial [Phaeothamnion confervicola]
PVGAGCVVRALLLEVVAALVVGTDRPADRMVADCIWKCIGSPEATSALLTDVRRRANVNPCISLAKAAMRLLIAMLSSRHMTASVTLQEAARDSGALLWAIGLAIDTRDEDFAAVANRLVCALADGCPRSMGVVVRSFPLGLLAPIPHDQLFDELLAPPSGSANSKAAAAAGTGGWANVRRDFATPEVVWNAAARDALRSRLLAEVQALERERAWGPPVPVAWNDAAWFAPLHGAPVAGGTGGGGGSVGGGRGDVKVGRYYLEQLIAALDSTEPEAVSIRQKLSDRAALLDFLQLCHLRLLYETDAARIELVFEAMTCLFQHLGIPAGPGAAIFAAVVHMLRFSFPSLLGPIGMPVGVATAAAGLLGATAAAESGDGAAAGAGKGPVTAGWGQSSATYYAAVQFVRVALENQPANVRIFVSHDGVEAFVELIAAAFRCMQSVAASSGDGFGDSSTGGGDYGFDGARSPATSPARLGNGIMTVTAVPPLLPAVAAGASGAAATGACRELVRECIACLAAAMAVSPPLDARRRIFLPPPPPKRVLAAPAALGS